MTGKHSFIPYRPIKRNTVKYIYQSENSYKLVIGLNTSRYGRVIANWSVENMNPGFIPYMMLLDVSILESY